MVDEDVKDFLTARDFALFEGKINFIKLGNGGLKCI
jgi:hypothetical protein